MSRPDPAYDLVLDGKGYMLARGDQLGRGARSWATEAVGAAIAEPTASEARYSNQPAIIEIPMVFRSTHSGYGDEVVRGENRYHYAVNADGRFPNLVLPGPAVTSITVNGSANVNGFFEQDGMLFCLAGRYCVQLESDDTVTTAKDFGSGKAATDAAVYNGTAYIGMGTSEGFWQRESNADPTLTWTQASGLYIGYLCVFKDRIWASSSNYRVRSVATAPLTANNWHPTTAANGYPIGESTRDITSMAELGGLLHIGKSDGLYVLDESGVAQAVTPELKAVISGNNCQRMRAWHGSLWVPHIRGLLNYKNLGASGFLVTPATPGSFAGADNPIHGRVTALAGDNRWLYVALYVPGGDTYLLAGREAFENEPGLGPIVWHPLVKLASTQVDAMHISGLWTNPRLYFGRGANVGYIVLPRNGENPVQDTNCTYATSGSFYYSGHSWYAPTTYKVWKQIEIESKGLTSARYLTVYYRVDGAQWVEAGTATRSPRDVIQLPGAGVSGTKIEIRLDYTMPSATTPFQVYSVVARGAERPQTVKVITAQIRCADGLTLRNGAKERRKGAEILTDLEALSIARNAVILKDTIGVERRVLVLPPIGETESEQAGTLQPEKLAVVRMAVFEAESRPAGNSGWFIIGTSQIGGSDKIAPS